MTKEKEIINWVGKIQIHQSNFKSLDKEILDYGSPKGEYKVYRYSSIQLSMFYKLYSLSHKWKKTIFIINGNPVNPSTEVTKVFRCCFDFSEWPQKQNAFLRSQGRSEKHLELIHYCYGYERTIHNIVGCQRIKSARDERGGWMGYEYFRVDGDNFELNFDKLKKSKGKEVP